MGRTRKPAKASGATALADALTIALRRTAVVGLNPYVEELVNREGRTVLYAGGRNAGRSYVNQQLKEFLTAPVKERKPYNQRQQTHEDIYVRGEMVDPDSYKAYALAALPSDPPRLPSDYEAQKLARELNATKIAKLSAIIKRHEPRLFMEVLQTFGSIEGLNAKRQADLINRLETIKKDYLL